MFFGLPLGGLVAIAFAAIFILNWIKVLNEYERGVIFRFGKLLPKPRGPGLVLVFSPIDRMVRISLRLVAFDVPPQDIVTRDNVSVKVNAVVFFFHERAWESRDRPALLDVLVHRHGTEERSLPG